MNTLESFAYLCTNKWLKYQDSCMTRWRVIGTAVHHRLQLQMGFKPRTQKLAVNYTVSKLPGHFFKLLMHDSMVSLNIWSLQSSTWYNSTDLTATVTELTNRRPCKWPLDRQSFVKTRTAIKRDPATLTFSNWCLCVLWMVHRLAGLLKEFPFPLTTGNVEQATWIFILK